MGMDGSTLSWAIKKYCLKVNSNPNRGRTPWDKTGFYNWWNGIKLESKEEPTPEPSDELIAVNENAEIQNYVENDVAITEEMAKQVTVKDFRECKEFSEIPTICTNPYHHIPVIPKSGTMIFNGNRAEDALATMKSLLQDARINITITWSMVEDNSVSVSPDVYEETLKKQAATVNYALLNAQRKVQMNTNG